MKVVSLYSPSHERMLNEYFLPSFPKDERLQLKVVPAPQLAGEKPLFNSPEWKNFMHIKAKLLWDELLSTPENEFYLFLDVDILCVGNFHDYITLAMESLDVLAQSDSPNPRFLNVCTGIIALRNTEATRNLMRATNEFLDKFKNEQEAVTYFIDNHTKFQELLNLRWNLIPFDTAYTYGSIAGQVWAGQDNNFSLPSKRTLKFVHANYCHHEWKEKLLDLFKEKLA